MSEQNWKPGDVALVHVTRWSGAREWPDDTSRVLIRVTDGNYLEAVDGDPAAPFCVPPSVHEYARRLVVIDPEEESDESVSRLCDLIRKHHGKESGVWTGLDWLSVQAALREYINPMPPKPEEPTGDGAVVVDRVGNRWVRIASQNGSPDSPPWRHRGHAARHWDALTAVEVLSEGVTP